MISFNEEIRENKAPFGKALRTLAKTLFLVFLLAKRKLQREVYCTAAKLALSILFYCMLY